MANRNTLGGVIHTYQRYDPARFPSPTQPPPDLVSPVLEHMLMFGEHRELTEEELARAIRLDPSQIAGLGPSIDALIAMLQERKRKILARYETRTVRQRAHQAFADQATEAQVPKKFRERFTRRCKTEQIRDLERLWYAAGDDQSPCAGALVGVIERLGDKYQVDELAAKYEFTGHEAMTVPQALAIKEELEKIDELLKQLEEARKTARIGIIDMDLLSEFAEPGDVDQLSALQQQIQDYLRELAEQQGLEQKAGSFRLTPKAYRLFQGKLLERLFQRNGALAHRPASGAGRRRRRRRAAGHQALRVRRLDRQPRHPGHVRQRAGAQRPGHAGALQRRRHPGPPHAQHAQVRHLRAHGHERLDALRRPVHQRQAHGPGARRPHPPRLPGRLAAVHRNVHVRQARSSRAGSST